MSIVTTVTPQQITWDKPKLFYKTDITEYTATSTASGYDADNMLNRLELLKWKSGLTTTQYLTVDASQYFETSNDVFADSTYIYVADGAGGIAVYDKTDFSLKSRYNSDSYNYTGVTGDGTFIYAVSFQNALESLEVSSIGVLTRVDINTDGGNVDKLWTDGSYIYVSSGLDGVDSFSVDVSGNLTHEDNDDPGGQISYVWGDGSYIFATDISGDLHSYSSAAGVLTLEDSDDQGGALSGVWGDGTFIYACGNDGLLSYSRDGSGLLTYIDTSDPGGKAWSVWGDGTFIYTGNIDGEIWSYSSDVSGNLTSIDNTDITTNPGGSTNVYGVWADADEIYTANDKYGFSKIDADVSGNLSILHTTRPEITADYIVIAGHNLENVTVTLQYDTSADWATSSNIYSEIILSNDLYLKEFTSVTDRYFRIKLENCTVEPEIAIMYWGETVELEYCENDFDPNAFSDKANINKSQTGYVLGIYNRYKERSFTLSWNDAESDLYDKIKNLVDTVGRQNFVIAWESEAHSDDIFLVYIDGDFNNPYTRQAQYRNISLPLKGRVE